MKDVLDTATLRPAELIGRKELASMEYGTTADISIFRIIEKDVPYRDINGHTFTGFG